MSALTDRLRGAIAGVGGPKGPPLRSGVLTGEFAEGTLLRIPNPESRIPDHDAVADVLGGDWHGSGGQRFLVIDRTYAPGHRHGRVVMADALPPSDGLWPAVSLLAGTAQAARAHDSLLFIDLETKI